MSHWKAFAISAVTTAAIVAVIFRVDSLRTLVTGKA
jgi:hypothetical protein